MICNECGCYMLCSIVSERGGYEANIRCLMCGRREIMFVDDIDETNILKVRDIIRYRFNNLKEDVWI